MIGLSEEQQRASKIIGNSSVNLLVAAAAPGALARLGGTRVGGAVLGSRPGQIISKAITNRYTQAGLLTLNSGNALRHGYKTVDAILEGRNLDALENAVYTSENVFGVYNIGKGFAKPVRANVVAPAKPFVEQMTPAEAARYRAYWESRPSNPVRFRDQAAPGTQTIRDPKISTETGEVYMRESIYDQFGRRIGTNEYTTHGRTDHTLPHYHTRNPITGQREGPFPGLHPETPQ
ncbi:MAG: hypothetical protein JW829_07295 [Pirellulales bacterium]|nr:hypothetical protein [Pirellulales bacterium]